MTKAKKGKFGIGLLIGAIVGGVAALLAAPKSGKETRADLKRHAESAKDEVVKHAGHARDAAEGVAQAAGGVKNVADSAIDGAKEGYEKSRRDHKKD